MTIRPRSIVASLLSALLLAGCTNTYKLRYQADPQPKGADIYADYTAVQDSIAVSIDTGENRLESVFVQKPDGSTIRPLKVVLPGSGRPPPPPPSVAPRVNSGMGTVSTPVPPSPAPEPPAALTTATFSKEDLGPPPWQLHIKVQNIPEVIIPALGGPANAR